MVEARTACGRVIGVREREKAAGAGCGWFPGRLPIELLNNTKHCMKSIKSE